MDNVASFRKKRKSEQNWLRRIYSAITKKITIFDLLFVGIGTLSVAPVMAGIL